MSVTSSTTISLQGQALPFEPPGPLAPVPSQPAAGADGAKWKEAAEGFEAYFIKMLLGEMQKSVGEGGLFGSDTALRGYRTIIDDALAKRAAQAGSFGLARQLLRQWESQR
jgi:Rod binding domain-containing protein